MLSGFAPRTSLNSRSKNSSFNASEGLPQLLTYMDYQFVYLQQGNPPIYELLPKLDITRPESSSELLQVLKAIRQEYNAHQ